MKIEKNDPANMFLFFFYLFNAGLVATCNRAPFFSFHLLVTIISMYCMQSRFEKNCATLRKVCASAKSFAEELSRPPKPACALSSAGTRRGHFRTADKTYALYSAADVPSSRAIQRGDGQAIRAVQRGKRTKLTRYTARRQ